MAGALRVTGLLELGGMDLSLDSRRIKGVRKAASLYLPHVKSMKPDKVWRGLRPCTSDGLPLLGRRKACNNVLAAGGHVTKGMTWGPFSGRLVARILSGRGRSADYEKALSPRRFGA